MTVALTIAVVVLWLLLVLALGNLLRVQRLLSAPVTDLTVAHVDGQVLWAHVNGLPVDVVADSTWSSFGATVVYVRVAPEEGDR